jgi:hypothetical protein
MMDKKQPVRVQLESGFTAVAEWRGHYWTFAYEEVGGFTQMTPLVGENPHETIWSNLVRYELPLPASDTDKATFHRWLQANGMSYRFEPDEYESENDDDIPW